MRKSKQTTTLILICIAIFLGWITANAIADYMSGVRYSPDNISFTPQ